jgi:DNA adenine methylase
VSKITSPPLRYPGGKWRIASWIIAQFPPHVCYVEPFCGGAAVLFAKQPSTYEVINDLDNDVINFFEVLRRQPDELMRLLSLTPFARAEYELSYEKSNDPLENARRFYVRCRQSWGYLGAQSGWRYQKTLARGKRLQDEWNDLDGLYAAADRLKNVFIEHDDALKIIARYDAPGTLFYVDPPYVGTSRSRQNHYVHEFSDLAHCELAGMLNHVAGSVILSGYPSQLYDDLYPGWLTYETRVQTNGKGSRIEKMWISPKALELERLPLFQEINNVPCTRKI